MCFSPFGGVGGRIYSVFGREPWGKNPTLCNVCQSFAAKHPGGAEIDLTMLFADVRGSTTMAEGMSPTEFNTLLNLFFVQATKVLIDHGAWIDKFVGDEIVAFFFGRSVEGRHHAQVGIDASRDLLRATEASTLPIGVGVHSGTAFVGTVGGEQVSDVTAVGDDVNVTARLASAAEANTIVVSEAACRSAGLDKEVGVRRELVLKGKSAPVPVRVFRR